MNQTTDTLNATETQPAVKTFPTEGTHLAKILADRQYRQTFHVQLKRYNPLVVAFYRLGLLPLLGMSRTVMLLTTQGRKSGKLRSTPIGYFRIGGQVYLFSAWGKNTAWFRNMTAHPEAVWIRIGMRKQPVRAQVMDDPAEIRCLMEQFITESPDKARTLIGWEPGHDKLASADFSTILNQVLIVRFTPKPE